jgi:hypothetical protein
VITLGGGLFRRVVTSQQLDRSRAQIKRKCGIVLHPSALKLIGIVSVRDCANVRCEDGCGSANCECPLDGEFRRVSRARAV